MIVGNSIKAGVRKTDLLSKSIEFARNLHPTIGFLAFDTFRDLLQDDKGKISGPRTVLAGLGAGAPILPENGHQALINAKFKVSVNRCWL